MPDFTSNDEDDRTISPLLLDDYFFDDWVDQAAKTVLNVGIDDVS